MKISYSDLNRLNRWEVFQFLAHVLKFTESIEEEMPELYTNQLAKFDAAFKIYDEALVQEQQKTSKRLIMAEEMRDYAVRKIYNICREYSDYSFDKMKEQSANVLLDIFKPYGTGYAIASMPQDVESAVLINLLQDFTSEKAETSIEQLELVSAVETLKQSNFEFDNKQFERSVTQAEFISGVVKDARNDVQDEFMRFVDVVNALSIVEGEEKYLKLKEYIINRLSEYVVKAKQRTKKKEEEAPEVIIN